MSLAIINGTVIDGSGKDPRPNMTVVIQEGRIKALGRTNQVKIPRGTPIVDAQGNSVLPGLINTHFPFLIEYPGLTRQLITPPSLRLFEAIPRMRATLDAGVTTVRDAGG